MGDKSDSGDLTIVDGSTFFVSDPSGDVEATRAEGFFHTDMRHLSRLRLWIDGERPRTLSARTVDYYSARVVSDACVDADTDAPAIGVRRERFVADGLHEDVVLENLTGSRRRVELVLELDSDFGDIFECRTHPEKKGRLSQEVADDGLALRYERDGFRRATLVRFSRDGTLGVGRAQFDVELGPRETWSTCVDIVPVIDGEEHPARRRCGEFGRAEPNMAVSLEEWLHAAPELETEWEALRRTYRQSLLDLAALRFYRVEDATRSLPAGGLPWFMTLFGRDSLVTAYQALPFQPELARTTLEVLAELQADEYSDFHDAEPGKIVHELRRGELAELGDVPHAAYYGAHDTTPLFLVLLEEYLRWTDDRELVLALEEPARRALRWLEEEADLDGDGLLEYRTRSSAGLDNQGWKDSWDAILFADGRLAEPPLATCELQGYAFDAFRRTAGLARTVWDDAELGERLDARAEELRRRFEEAFWDEERGHYALALDGDKNRVDSLTSNIGHVLWDGIASPERAAATRDSLLSPDLFSGWGIRTMSRADAGSNPLAYHRGAVWPHDTAICAEGLRRYGFRDEASCVAVALLEAADAFGGRLPELFGGFGRAETGFPVEYEGASSPQSFAAGAVLLALRTLLGLDARDGEIVVDPCLPERVAGLRLSL